MTATSQSSAIMSPSVLIFMGVAGSGKTTVATLCAKLTGAVFHEGDDFHPPENIAKMRRGIPLDDADRSEWLEKLRKIIASSLAGNRLTVVTCSALKAKYRKKLSGGDPRVKFVHLTGPPALIEKRLKNRAQHFMPPSLLQSQLADLEPPSDALVFSCEMPPQEIAEELVRRVSG